jgi:membrane-bound lytic murein transglycosylase D
VLIATSEKHFATGEHELALGHLDRARAEFDLALDILLQSPAGARSDARLREHFDRLVDRISAREVAALAQGDGFTEKKYEPASIDELLAIATFDSTSATPALKETVEADLARGAHDIPISLNARVLSYIELFQGRLREFIQEGLQRGARYLPMIQNVFRAEGLPLDLAYVPLIESAFKTNALSRAKAKGVWQFMTPTARDYGLRLDWYVDERSDPEKATRAAAQHLRMLYELFDGDWHLALASYNWGQGRLQTVVKRTGITDFWQLSTSAKYLPRETREYVPMILAAIVIARNPVEYGFTFAAESPVAYDTVPVQRAVDLRRVAEWTSSSIDEIQGLNPELRRWTTPVKQSGYELKVPVGTGDALRERLDTASPRELNALTWYTVRRGDSLATVARRLKVSRTDLAEANHLTLRSRLVVGQDLIVPRALSPALSARSSPPAPAAEAVVASRGLNGTADSPTAESSKLVKRVYLVKRGDTLSSIARLFNTTVARLKSWNRLRGTHITAGTRLTVFATRSIGTSGGE